MTGGRGSIAAAGTLLGRLQRGTGAGYLEALGPGRIAARETLAAAIRFDPRWDQQLDSRSWYYAHLSVAVGLSSEDIERGILAAVDRHPDGGLETLGVEVLGQLAGLGDESAAGRLVDSIRYGGRIDTAVAWCVRHGDESDRDRLLAALAARFPNAAAVRRDAAVQGHGDVGWMLDCLEPLAAHDARFARVVRLLQPVAAVRSAERSRREPMAEQVSAAPTFEDACRVFLTAEGIGLPDSHDALVRLESRHTPGHDAWLADFLLAEHDAGSTGGLGDLAGLLPVDTWPDFIRSALAAAATRTAAGPASTRCSTRTGPSRP